MTARTLIVMAVLGLAFVAASRATEAQPPGKVPRIGILRDGSPPDPLVDAFRQGLRDLGYTEENIRIEYRWAEGRDERLPALIADLVRLEVEVIVAGGSLALLAKRATSTIPIVMPVAPDPVESGLVASFARPGGNVTGLAFQSDMLPGKWLQLLREAVPGIARVAVLWHPPTVTAQLRVVEGAARSVGVRVHALRVQRPDDLEAALASARKERAEALMVLASPFFFAHRTRLVELAAKHRLPAMYFQREFVLGSGGLMSYGPNLRDLFQRAATYVDRVLKGAKPGDLPIEQPTKFELMINLKTAKALELTIPQSLLARADEVIQ